MMRASKDQHPFKNGSSFGYDGRHHGSKSDHGVSKSRASAELGPQLTGQRRAIYMKTKVCRFFEKGLCRKGRDCTYAHNMEEVRQLPDLRCTKLCPWMLAAGRCNDQNCRYAHHKSELRRRPVSVTDSSNAQSAQGRPRPPPLVAVEDPNEGQFLGDEVVPVQRPPQRLKTMDYFEPIGDWAWEEPEQEPRLSLEEASTVEKTNSLDWVSSSDETDYMRQYSADGLGHGSPGSTVCTACTPACGQLVPCTVCCSGAMQAGEQTTAETAPVKMCLGCVQLVPVMLMQSATSPEGVSMPSYTAVAVPPASPLMAPMIWPGTPTIVSNMPPSPMLGPMMPPMSPMAGPMMMPASPNWTGNPMVVPAAANQAQQSEEPCLDISSCVAHIKWIVDARRLEHASERRFVSPPFKLVIGTQSATFKLIILPKVRNGATSSFQSSHGKALVQVKCDAELGQASAPVEFTIAVGNAQKMQPVRGPVRHCFAQNAIGGLPRDQEEWDLHAAVDQATQSFLVEFEVRPENLRSDAAGLVCTTIG
eukprot:TRINITY_DN91469_c0_g1_i1.p1 TRINITY_DN91469_c0_g1~~TRINITY_DN91469_c0_g1_i1.p1  ORF type:complete len:533 (+),score=78.89 TRINITY_DN91469_c0_g1_i1:124-1722(+)